MLINIFSTGEASYSSRVYNFFSPAPKADSLVDKVLKLFMAIILAPVSVAKYSVGFVISFKKEKSKTTIEKLAFAANSAVSRIKEAVEPFKDLAVKNKSTIIKIVIAAAVVTGAVYVYRSSNSEVKTQPDSSGVPVVIGGVLATALFGALGIPKLIKIDENAIIDPPIERALKLINDIKITSEKALAELENADHNFKEIKILQKKAKEFDEIVTSNISEKEVEKALVDLQKIHNALVKILNHVWLNEYTLIDINDIMKLRTDLLHQLKDFKPEEVADAKNPLSEDINEDNINRLVDTANQDPTNIQPVFNELSKMLTDIESFKKGLES